MNFEKIISVITGQLKRPADSPITCERTHCLHSMCEFIDTLGMSVTVCDTHCNIRWIICWSLSSSSLALLIHLSSSTTMLEKLGLFHFKYKFSASVERQKSAMLLFPHSIYNNCQFTLYNAKTECTSTGPKVAGSVWGKQPLILRDW